MDQHGKLQSPQEYSTPHPRGHCRITTVQVHEVRDTCIMRSLVMTEVPLHAEINTD